MKFLVDAHLPRRLVHWLREAGHDVVHTFDLPLGNRTPDSAVNDISLHEERVVVTKDEDFVDSFLLHHQPLYQIPVGSIDVHDGSLNERRLLGVKAGQVRFRYRNSREGKEQVMALSIDDFSTCSSLPFSIR